MDAVPVFGIGLILNILFRTWHCVTSIFAVLVSSAMPTAI